MSQAPLFVPLPRRALIAVSGPDWRSFLQGQLTQDVETLAPGEIRFGALLTPQGRLLFDLFIIGLEEGCWLDVAAERRAALIQRLTMYRLRAKVELAADETGVSAFLPRERSEDGGRWPQAGGGGLLQPTTPAISAASTPPPSLRDTSPRPLRESGEDWLLSDPRLPALGLRGYGATPPDDAEVAEEVAYDAHRLSLGVPDTADWGEDRTYPIEADFDLLNGIDFKKGCFVGQETTSRMKRRGVIKTRMAPITFEGPPPPHGAEVLAGELRAGEVLSGVEGRAMALLRLDRIGGALSVDGRPVQAALPPWVI